MSNLKEFLIFEYESAYDLLVNKNHFPPTLYTAKGEFSQRWYVYFYCRNPEAGKLKRVPPFYD